MSKIINIAIDRAIASGKTIVGKLIAKNLNYQFINTGVFYHYLDYKYIYSIQNNTFFDNLNNFKNNDILNEINMVINNLSEEDYFFSGQQTAELSKNKEIHILNRDSKSFNLIKEVKKVSKIIDTTNLTLAKVVDLVLIQKLSNEVNNDAFEFVFPNKDERLTFARNLLEYNNARVLEIKRIEGVMSKKEYIKTLENEIVVDKEE
ncbi:hypothetical protein C2G38_2220469 [Gigaspora rosea]|uniref:(d)CMP kinase n=1 Tax=Gigaspora rosea TaxID=44941 RepID=A0A397U7V4_9GLOM|nr:hypothetical protein C2G38_2220469 [Gigaspora rosea]